MGKFYRGVSDELTLLARQWGWLTAIPMLKGLDGKEQPQPTRAEAYKAGGAEAPLPSTEARHLFDWLLEIGPIEAGAMGRAPIGWSTLRAWQEATSTALAPWEARLIRRMSVAYLAESVAAADPLHPAPWSAQPADIDQDANERQLRAVLG